MALKPLSKAARRRVQKALDCEEGAFEKLKTPIELHYYASTWNWDDGFEPLRTIIRDPRCDSGTALLIYWRANPYWFCQFANREEAAAMRADLELYDLLKEIEERNLGGFYKGHDIRFDPSNDRGADWIKENSRSECKQPIPNKMREPSPGVELPAWDDLFETRVRPITDKEREKLDRLIAQGSKLLGLRDDTASSGDAPDPASVVQLIEKYIVEYRTRAKGKAGDPDVEKALRKLDESLGYLWAEQVCRAYNWDWAAWDWGEGSTPMIKPAGEEFMVNPTAPIRQSLADSWPEPEAGSISRFFTELKQVKSWPNRRISELNSIGWIFAPPWINLRDRKPV